MIGHARGGIHERAVEGGHQFQVRVLLANVGSQSVIGDDSLAAMALCHGQEQVPVRILVSDGIYVQP